MSGEVKAREFWLTSAHVQTKVDGGFVQETRMALTFVPGVQILGEHIHVIEKSAYQKAVDGLKEIAEKGYYSGGSSKDQLLERLDEYCDLARTVLKELGEM